MLESMADSDGSTRGACLLYPVRAAGAFNRSMGRSVRFLTHGTRPGRFLERELPAPARSLTTAIHTIADEIVVGGFQTLKRPPAPGTMARTETETDAALRVFERRGWLDEPASYHRDPPELIDVHPSRHRAFLQTFDTISFDSGYEPHLDEPGRERWLSRRENRKVRAIVLRHDDGPRPWLVCVHGAEMARATIDVKYFRAEYLHRVLGLNVVLPVLPLHGPRGKDTDAEFPTIDVVDNVHGLAQAVWDVRRVLSWVRSQEPTGVGIMGFSLGGYTTALVAGFEPDLECVIAGGPATDFPTLMRRNATKEMRIDPDFQRLMDKSERLHRVVSPLVIPPRPMRDRLFIFAGLADRLAHPIDQVADLWDHWGKPEILWHDGGHLGHRWVSEVARFVDDAVHDTLVADDDRREAVAT